MHKTTRNKNTLQLSAYHVRFCHRGGLDYVSCSPFRVPVARLAAAHAALEETS